MEFAILTFVNTVSKDDPYGVAFDVILLAEMKHQGFSDEDARKALAASGYR